MMSKETQTLKASLTPTLFDASNSISQPELVCVSGYKREREKRKRKENSFVLVKMELQVSLVLNTILNIVLLPSLTF